MDLAPFPPQLLPPLSEPEALPSRRPQGGRGGEGVKFK